MDLLALPAFGPSPAALRRRAQRRERYERWRARRDEAAAASDEPPEVAATSTPERSALEAVRTWALARESAPELVERLRRRAVVVVRREDVDEGLRARLLAELGEVEGDEDEEETMSGENGNGVRPQIVAEAEDDAATPEADEARATSHEDEAGDVQDDAEPAATALRSLPRPCGRGCGRVLAARGVKGHERTCRGSAPTGATVVPPAPAAPARRDVLAVLAEARDVLATLPVAVRRAGLALLGAALETGEAA